MNTEAVPFFNGYYLDITDRVPSFLSEEGGIHDNKQRSTMRLLSELSWLRGMFGHPNAAPR